MAELYLLRHGIAEERRTGRSDESRRLTAEGRKKLRRVLEAARGLGARVDAIVSSPLTRAIETAGIAAEILGGKVEQDDALSPGSSPEAAVAAARARARSGAVVLVGHEPLLGQTASFLLQARAGAIELKKGSLARFETDLKRGRNTAVLKWLLTPKLSHGIQHRS